MALKYPKAVVKAQRKNVPAVDAEADREMWGHCRRVVADDESVDVDGDGGGKGNGKTREKEEDRGLRDRGKDVRPRMEMVGSDNGASVADVLADVEKGVGRMIRGLPLPAAEAAV